MAEEDVTNEPVQKKAMPDQAGKSAASDAAGYPPESSEEDDDEAEPHDVSSETEGTKQVGEDMEMVDLSSDANDENDEIGDDDAEDSRLVIAAETEALAKESVLHKLEELEASGLREHDDAAEEFFADGFKIMVEGLGSGGR